MNRPDVDRYKAIIPEVLESRSISEANLAKAIEYIEYLEKQNKDMKYDFNSTLENFWTTSECYLSGMKAWQSDFSTRQWIKDMVSKYKFF